MMETKKPEQVDNIPSYWGNIVNFYSRNIFNNSKTMKKIILLSLMSLLCTTSLLAQTVVESEKNRIKQVIQNAYIDGLCNNADEIAVNKGFHPGFNLIGIGEGNTMWEYPIYNWIENAKKGKAKYKYAFQNEFTSVKYLFIDISGNVAITKLEFYEGGIAKYIDYLSLMKFEAGWKIVSKMFYAIPKKEN